MLAQVQTPVLVVGALLAAPSFWYVAKTGTPRRSALAAQAG